MIRISRQRRMLIGCLGAALATAASLALPAQVAIARGDLEADVTAAPEDEAPAPTKGEQRLAKLLEGRVAGEPVRCISAFRNVQMQAIDGTAYVYGSGNQIWVQRTRNPADIDSNDILVNDRREASQLCRLDIASTIDRNTGFFTGAVFFEDFVPYTRVKPGSGSGG